MPFPADWAFYKDITLAGTTPATRSVQFRVWKDTPIASGYSNVTRSSTDLAAHQGVCYIPAGVIDASPRLLTSGAEYGGSASENWINFFTYSDLATLAGVTLDFQHDTNPDNSGLHQQVNGMFYRESDGLLYVSANGFPGNSNSWIYVYDPTDMASGLVTSYPITSETSEDVIFADGYAWISYNNTHYIEQRDQTTFALVKTHNLPGENPPGSFWWQGLTRIGSLWYINLHETEPFSPHPPGNRSQMVNVYHFDGTDFIEVARLTPATDWTGQGIHWVPEEKLLLWAERDYSDLENDDRVVVCGVTALPGDVGCELNCEDDFGDVRITSADGSAVYAGETATGWLEHFEQDWVGAGLYAWVHAEIPAQTTSEDYRLYYGSPGAAFSGDRAGVVSAANDFEGGAADLGDFTNVYNTAALTNVTTDPLEGARHVNLNATSGGVHPANNTFVDQGWRASGWMRRVGSGSTARVWMTEWTGSSSNIKRTALSFEELRFQCWSGGAYVTVNNAWGNSPDPYEHWFRWECVWDYDANLGYWKHWGPRGLGELVTFTATLQTASAPYRDIMLYNLNTADAMHDLIFSRIDAGLTVTAVGEEVPLVSAGAIALGDVAIDAVALGDTPVDALALGDTQFWP